MTSNPLNIILSKDLEKLKFEVVKDDSALSLSIRRKLYGLIMLPSKNDIENKFISDDFHLTIL